MQAYQNTKPTQNYLSIDQTLYINPHYSHHLVYTGNSITFPQESPPKQLYFEFFIKPLDSIRLLSQNNKSIVRLTLGTLEIKINLIKDNTQFLFQEGIYRNYLSTQLTMDGMERVQAGRKQVKMGSWTRMLVIVEKMISVGKNKWSLQHCNPALQIGDFKRDKCFQFKIKHLKLTSNKANLLKQIKTPDNIIKKQVALYDGPLDTIPKTQIPNYKTLQKYNSPPQKSDKLYFCHDMAGGYQQDMNKHHPYPNQKNKYDLDKNYQHTYRCLHLVQTSIFNYFSHHLITIPPKHWRRLCKKSGTLCLGTLIVQHNKPTEQQYLTDYTIKLLVYFCRRYKFDGYLINFQYKIKNINKLTSWLQKLVQQVHEAVPGSKIIWYDSVIIKGNVSYQNQINQNNVIFYKTCDGMFLNYWWNQDKLKSTLEYKIQNKNIYVGTDCFGRGTYQGGGFNTFKAINAIRKIDKGQGILAPALFAMGYTYEMDKNNIQTWKLHEKCMYRGMSLNKQQIPHKQWQYVNNYTNGFNWKIQNQWAITSFQNCRRMLGIKINSFLTNEQPQKLTFTFFTTVQGTGPKFQDVYRVLLNLYIGQLQINSVETGLKHASQNQQIVQLKMTIDCDIINQDTKIIIVQQGHDVQKWGGHYGTRFKNDSLYVMKYSKQTDWIAKYRTNFINGVSLPYRTDYNLGHGHDFYLNGKKIKRSYDYMSDYQVNFAYIMNPPLVVNICYSDAYTGGTCLAVQGTLKLKLIQILISNKNAEKSNKQKQMLQIQNQAEKQKKQQKNLQKQKQKIKIIKGKVVAKRLQDKQKFKISYRWEDQLKYAKLQQNQKLTNGWIIINFQIQLILQEQQQQQQQIEIDKLTLYLESTNQNKYLLGQTIVFQSCQNNKNTQKFKNIKIQQLILKSSQHNPPISPLLFDAHIKLNNPQKILIEYGQNFACFGYADQLNNNLITIKNIHSIQTHHINKKIVLKISVMNQCMEFVEIKKVEVDGKKLAYQGFISYL